MNALPEVAWAVANNRIADYSFLSELMAHVTDVALPMATKHNMTLEAFGKTVGLQGSSWGTIRLSNTSHSPLEPAPVSPTTGSGPYELLSGIIRSVFQTHLRTDNLPKFAIVSPALDVGEFLHP